MKARVAVGSTMLVAALSFGVQVVRGPQWPAEAVEVAAEFMRAFPLADSASAGLRAAG